MRARNNIASKERSEDITTQDGVSGQRSSAALQGERRHEISGVGDRRAPAVGGTVEELAAYIESLPESATSHINNALAVAAGQITRIEEDGGRREEIETLQAIESRLRRAVDVLKVHEDELLLLRTENRNLLSAIGAPRPVSSAALIDTHRGDTLAVVMSDGSCWRYGIITPHSHGRFEDTYEWQQLPPVPTSKAALLTMESAASATDASTSEISLV
jgi:hypothetical protein